MVEVEFVSLEGYGSFAGFHAVIFVVPVSCSVDDCSLAEAEFHVYSFDCEVSFAYEFKGALSYDCVVSFSVVFCDGKGCGGEG